MSEDVDQIDFTKVKIKQEKASPPRKKQIEDIAEMVIPNLFNASARKPQTEDETDEKKTVEPIKSSNEILAELFRVFNATPPESLLNDEILLEKKKKKHKDKKHKKKSKKRGRDSSRESDSNDDKSKVKKKKKHKKHKKESEERKEEKVTRIKEEPSSPSARKEKSQTKKSPSNDVKGSDGSDFTISSEDETNVRIPREPIAIKKEKDPSPKPAGRKIVIKNLKESKVLEEACKKRISERDSAKKSDGECSDISLSDEETYTREQQNRSRSRQSYDRRRGDDRRSRFGRNNYRNSRSRDRARKRWNSSRSRSRSRSRFWRRSRSRSRSRRPDDLHIDKKRLLEIARKNAISMFKNGSLPGTQSLPQEVKDKVLMKMRYGGKTVEELTEFCKKLSNGESLNDLSSLSSNEDSDYDKHGNDKAFHHPFVLKDRGPIVMNIKNATPIPPKTAEQAKAILTQFPVSSGQQHRLHESEWIPVPTTKPAKVDPPPVVTVAKPTLPKNVFAKPLPIETQQPAFVPTNPLASVVPSTDSIPLPQAAPPALPTTVPVPPATVPILPPEPLNTPTNIRSDSNNVFRNLDVSPIITQRLHAMRKLQQNPNDPEALQMIATAHQDITVWARSMEPPGKFTGSTGANILTPQELSAGQQAWVKRDQLITTAPVSGGMGMHLLQKMGWKPGEGLGKTKNGCLQPLLLEVKMDKRGLVTKEEHRIPPLLPPTLLSTVRPPPPLLSSLRPAPSRPPAPPFPPKKRAAPVTPAQVQLNIENKHPVSLLGELCGKRKWGPPAYELINEEGPSHRKNFIFNVVVNGMMYQPSIPSKSKKDAKALAAKYCLQQLGILPTT